MKRSALLAWTFLLCGGAAAAELPSLASYTPQDLADRAQIEDVISALALSVDQRQWDAVRQTLADRVELGLPAGYPKGSGAPRTDTISADQFIAASKSELPGYQHTQHMVTNPIVRIHGDRATVVAQMQIAHYLPNKEGKPFWVMVGTYDYQMVRTSRGWKIASLHVNKLFEFGNRKLPTLASARVRAGRIATVP